METHIQVTVEIDGQKKIDIFSSLNIIQRHDWHHSFELRMSLADGKGEARQDYIGKQIKIEFKAHKHEEKKVTELTNLFNGIITEVALSRYNGSESDVVLKGYSPSILMDNGPNVRTYLKKSIEDVVKDITGLYPSNLLNPKVDSGLTEEVEYVAQYNESCYNFVGRLANQYGKWFFFNGKEMIFGKLPKSDDDISLTFGENLISFDLGSKAFPAKFRVFSHNHVEHKNYSITAGSVSGLDSMGNGALSKSDSLFGSNTMSHTKEYHKSDGSLQKSADIKRAAVAAKMVVLTGNSVCPWLKVGGKVEVTDHGTYTIVSVSHFTDSLGTYQNRFEAIPSAVAIPPHNANFNDPHAEIQQAIVTDNKDPDGLGRVKISFSWADGKYETFWIRCLTPHAGKSRGVHFMPEIDDEVLVAFENNDPSRPYVIGSIYHGKADHKDRKGDENDTKTIRTLSGNEIKFYDKDGEEEVLIHNKDSQNMISLCLKDGGIIKIKSKNKIQIEAKEITMEAEEKITMKAKQITTSATEKIVVESNQKMELKAMEIKEEGSQKISIRAAQMEIKAQATLDIDGGGKASVKASGMLEVNGGANATIKGAIVMIN